MKTIILAAVAAAFVSNAHASEPTFAESCGHIENHTRFNPTELSEYQECWLGFHKPDEMAGVLGNIFWARAGDMTVSMPVSTLTNAGSKSAAQAIVVDRIVDRIVEVERELTQAQRDAIAMFERFSTVTDEATAKAFVLAETGIIVFTSAEVAAAEELARDAARVGYVTEADRDLDVAAVTIDTNDRFSDRGPGDRAMVITLTNEREIRVNADAAYNAGVSEINGAVHSVLRGSVGLGYTVNDAWNADRNTYYALVHVAAQAVVDAKARGLATFDATTQGSSYGAGGDDADNLSDIGRGWTDVNLDQTFSSGGLFITVAGDVVRYGTTGDNLWDVLNDAVEDVYDRGFNDGYDEGYTEGYADGFADGVASVN